MKRLAQLFDNYLYYFLLALVLIMPLHAFLAISIGHIIGHQAVLQAWKEVGMVFAAIAAWSIFFTNKEVKKRVAQQPAAWTAKAFIVVALIVTAISHSVGLYNVLLGVKTTLGFLVLFVAVQAARFTPKRWNTLIKALLIISSVVGIFAIAQVYLLPVDFLVRFGYGAATVPAFHLVDPAVTAVRIIATFSGPNQLGSFMIIPLVISAWLITRKKWLAIIPFVLSSFALVNSYSRSAWVGAGVALLMALAIRLQGYWRLALVGIMALLVIGGISLNAMSQDRLSKVRFYVHHGKVADGQVLGSDSNRLESAARGVDQVIQEPLGYGLGTAGPASQGASQSIITENTYLQVGIETGVVGLLLFIATIVLSIVALFKQRLAVDEASPLIAILLGLSVSNLFLHTWADSATALVLWGLVGYCLAAQPKRSKA